MNTLVDVVGYYANHDHDDRYVAYGNLDASIVVRGQLSPTGGLYESGSLPPGVTLTTTRTATGVYSIRLDGIQSLGISTSESATVLFEPRTTSALSCVAGSGGSGASGGVYTSVARTARCFNSNAEPTNIAVDFVFIL